MFAPLSIVNFRYLLASNFLWWQARWMESIVVGWLVLELTDSAWEVALVAFYRSIPFLLVGVFAGPIIDRYGRRNCILVAQGINFSISATVALLLWLDALAYWHIVTAALLMGTVWSIDWPARRSLIPDLVDKELTVDSMILEGMGQNVSRIVGPFASGALLATFGVTGSYIALAVTAGLAWLALLGLVNKEIPRTHMPDGRSPWHQIREGLRYTSQNQALLGVTIMTLIINMLVLTYIDLLPVFARDVLGQGPLGLGLLSAGGGLGAFIGLLIIGRLRGRISNGWILLGGTFAQCLLLILFANSPFYLLSLSFVILSAMGRASFGVMQSAIVLLASSDEMRSRVMGVMVLAIGLGPIGRLIIGALAENFGAPFAVTTLCAVAAVAIALLGILLPEFREQGEPVKN